MTDRTISLDAALEIHLAMVRICQDLADQQAMPDNWWIDEVAVQGTKLRALLTADPVGEAAVALAEAYLSHYDLAMEVDAPVAGSEGYGDWLLKWSRACDQLGRAGATYRAAKEVRDAE